MMRFDWDNIRFFLAVAETGSLSAAAKNMNSTQPTVGRHINSLEQATELRLFDRSREGFKLTKHGLTLLETARQMSRAADDFSRQQASLDQKTTGIVRISSNAQVGQFLFHRIETLKKSLPGIRIELVTSQLDPNMSKREADIHLRFCLPQTGDLFTQKLAEIDFAIFASQPLADRVPAIMDDSRFGLRNWVVFDERNQLETGNQWLLSRLTLEPDFLTDTVLNHREIVASGAAMGLMPVLAARCDPRLVRLTAPISELQQKLHMIIHRDLRKTPIVQATANALRELFSLKIDGSAMG